MFTFLTLLWVIQVHIGQSLDDKCSYQNGLLQCGPFYYPDDYGNATEGVISISALREVNSTHFGLTLVITGSYWFGFGFAQSGDSGCTLNSTDGECTMSGVDAIIFGDYGGDVEMAALEWTLGNNSNGLLHSSQDVSIEYLYEGNNVYQAVLTRPYNPYDYGDRDSYAITYPMAGTFCWLWAQGDGLSVSSTNAWVQSLDSGHRCLDLGGNTSAPTPSPSYGPSDMPTTSPTPKPSKAPTVYGDTASPTQSPTGNPTESPTYKPTVVAGEPTGAPTPEPTPFPTEQPSKEPTKSPTLEEGQTQSPTRDPTSSPTTFAPTTMEPTPSPTFASESASSSTFDDFSGSAAFYVIVVVLVLCFLGGPVIWFWFKQKKRSEARQQRRENLLKAEQIKEEQGLNIDKDPIFGGPAPTMRGPDGMMSLDYGAEDESGSDFDTDSEFGSDGLASPRNRGGSEATFATLKSGNSPRGNQGMNFGRAKSKFDVGGRETRSRGLSRAKGRTYVPKNRRGRRMKGGALPKPPTRNKANDSDSDTESEESS